MSSQFSKNTSSFFVTAFIALIIISFMFTGYESMRGTPDTVAKVGDMNISARDYQQEYNRQLQFYGQMFGGGSLSSQQIEQFGIKNNALNVLINRNLKILMGKELGIAPSVEEIKSAIKEDYKVFQVGGKFSLNVYKDVLRQNQWTPADFEELIRNDLTANQTKVIFESFPISSKYFDQVNKVKEIQGKGDVVQITREKLRNTLNVTQAQRDEFLKVETNLARVKSKFEENKATYEKPGEVSASHILIDPKKSDDKSAKAEAEKLLAKLTPSNFASMAKKHSQGPSAKDGGDLGTFSRGKMVKEFEDAAFKARRGEIVGPVKTQFGYHLIYVKDRKEAVIPKFETYRDQLANELIRAGMNDELDKLIEEVTAKTQKALDQNNKSELKNLVKKYNLAYNEGTIINAFEGNKGSVPLDSANVFDLLVKNELKNRTVKKFENAAKTRISFVAVAPFSGPVPEAKNSKENVDNPFQDPSQGDSTRGEIMGIRRNLEKGITDALKERYSVRVFEGRLR